MDGDIPFHNLNHKDFSLKKDGGIIDVFHHLSDSTEKNSHIMRMLKLKYWGKVRVFWESAMTCSKFSQGKMKMKMVTPKRLEKYF